MYKREIRLAPLLFRTREFPIVLKPFVLASWAPGLPTSLAIVLADHAGAAGVVVI